MMEENLLYIETDDKQVTVDTVDDGDFCCYLTVEKAGSEAVQVLITRDEAKRLSEAFQRFCAMT
jgi:hypothetical protein